MGHAIAKKMLFQPPVHKYPPNSNFFSLHTAGSHTIQAFFIRATDDGYCILFSHGNAEDLGNIYPWFKEVAVKMGVNVMCYDYTGYGLSGSPKNDPGPKEEHCFRDIEAAYEHLITTLNVPEDKIILYGRSLGSGPTCHLAKRQSEEGRIPVAGIILQSPLMSAFRVAFHFRYSFPGDMMCNIDKIPYIKSPVFILHGRRDEIVPFWHGEELYLATKEQYRYPPLWVDEAGHNNIEITLRRTGNHNTFFDILQNFIVYITKHPHGICVREGGREGRDCI